ncbi:hypothetical protein [Paraburkholderia sp. J7]|uniref:hypothetical protein n=1 Tax=Paraburkholderia sp. J7 TaxID=2805438 RepID=UPI002AB66340|nr:hypothetical protein [Paraburkholderia sp. J7]
MILKSKSNWTYDTGAGVNLGFHFLTVTDSVLVLDEPSGRAQQFKYTGSGLAASLLGLGHVKLSRLELPKLTILDRNFSGSVSGKGFTSGGAAYMTEAFHGAELHIGDFEGGTVSFDGSGGYIAGWSGSVIFAGIRLTMMEALIASVGIPFARNMFLQLALGSAPIIILNYGQTEGLIDSVGVDFMYGQLTYQGPEPIPHRVPIPEFPSGSE